MAQGGNRNQKQAARAAKRKVAVAAKKQAERIASSLSGRIAAAGAAPIARCVRTRDMVEAGIGHVILARRLPSGLLSCGFFLVDILCLGAKDAFFREMPPLDFEDHLASLAADLDFVVDMDPAAARKLVEGAVAFAAQSGLPPAKDYRAVVKLFGDVDAASSAESFTFGRAGHVVYVPGPSDSPTRMREVTRTLDRTRGPEGWDYPHPSEDKALRELVDLLEDGRGDAPFDDDDGLVIEHEGSTEPRDG